MPFGVRACLFEQSNLVAYMMRSRQQSTSSSRLGSLSAWGAKMRSFSVGAPSTSKSQAGRQRSSDVPDEQQDGVKKADREHSGSPARRRSSNVFGALKTNASRTDLRSSALTTVASSSGSSSTEQSQGKSSSSTHEEYRIVQGDDSVDEPVRSKWHVDCDAVYDDDDDDHHDMAKGYDGEAAGHISSANAYLGEDNSVVEVQSSMSPQSLGKRRRLSIPTLAHFRRSTSFLSPPIGTDSKDEEQDVDAVTSALQDCALETSTPTGTFNLRSFRNVRAGSPCGDQGSLLSFSDGDALNKRQQAGSVYEDQRTTLNLCASPARTPNSKPGTPMSSMPGSPLSDRPARSRAGSMTVGSFLRATAATQSRLDLLNADDDDVAGEGAGIGLALDGAGSRRNSGVLGSPYRPLTPLGSGARGPGEELAIIEADLERARKHSLMYLAQLEEKEMKRAEQRQRRRRTTCDDAILPADHVGRRDVHSSYFPPYNVGGNAVSLPRER